MVVRVILILLYVHDYRRTYFDGKYVLCLKKQNKMGFIIADVFLTFSNTHNAKEDFRKFTSLLLLS